MFDRAFSGVALDWTMPELQPPGAPPTLPPNTAQAEFRDPGAYFRESILKRLVVAGRQKLDSVEASRSPPSPPATASPRRSLSPSGGSETGFGAENLPKLVVPALATEAFIGLRKDYFRGELIAALKILQRGDVKPERDARLVGRRDGPVADHAVGVSHLGGRFRRRRPRRHLEVRARQPRHHRPTSSRRMAGRRTAAGASRRACRPPSPARSKVPTRASRWRSGGSSALRASMDRRCRPTRAATTCSCPPAAMARRSSSPTISMS